MVCALTTAQQRLLLGKVAIDLKKMGAFDFGAYAKEMYDLVLNKTSDPVLATNYVAMLPMNIRAVMGVEKDVFKKLAKDAELISMMEDVFGHDFKAVEEFVETFVTRNQELAQLQKDIQKASLTKPDEQQPAETPAVHFEPIVLADTPSELTAENQLKPDMKFYADAKGQLISGIKEDGSSTLGGIPVQLTIISTAGFQIGDFYPDTQAAILGGDERVKKASKEGVVIAVTDKAGNPIRFNSEYKEDPSGKIVYFTLRKPAADGKLNRADILAADQMVKQFGITQPEAFAIIDKQHATIRKIRDYVSQNPARNRVMLRMTGSTPILGAKRAAKNKVNIGKLNFSQTPFTPYAGVPERGQNPNVYYFEYGGVTMSVDSPAVPEELVERLTQLLTDSLKVKQGSKSFDYAMAERIKIFKQFVYNDPDVFDLSVGKDGELVIKKLGKVQKYNSVDEMAADIRNRLTRKVPVKKLTQAQAKGKTRAVKLETAMYNQVWEQVLPTGDVEYYEIGQVQLKVNKTAHKNNLYNDFTISNGVIKVEQRPYYSFIADNFLLNTNYDVDSAGNLVKVGSYINFQPDAGSVNKVIKQERASKKEPVQPVASENDLRREEIEHRREEELRVVPVMESVLTPVPKDVIIDLFSRYGYDPHDYLTLYQGNWDFDGIFRVFKEIREKINARYDAELAALKESETQAVVPAQSSAVVQPDPKIAELESENKRLRGIADSVRGMSGIQSNVRTEESRKIVNAARAIQGDPPYTGPLEGLSKAGDETGQIGYNTVRKLNNLAAASQEVIDGINQIIKLNNDLIEKSKKADFEKGQKSSKSALIKQSVKPDPNSTFYFDENGNLVDKTIKEVPKQEPKMSAKDRLLKLRKEDPKKFNKIIAQKGLEATLEQIDAAEKWYNNHPMSVYFPFEAMFDVINQRDSNSIATWTISGITLFKGADYSDLYHEAWHGFSQAFMSPEQRTKLYKEVRGKSGTFKDYRGNAVEFSVATDLQLEEYLAEDFREYMLTGKVLKDSPVRNNLFRRIVNFLKALFGSTQVRQGVVDQQVNATIADLYEKLRVGDLSDYSFAAENRNFDTLNKALTAIDETEPQKSLSFQNSHLIFGTINSLFSEAIDILNQQNISDIQEMRTLQAKENKTAEEKERLSELKAHNLSGYTTLMVSTTKGLSELYEYAKGSLEEKLAELMEKNNESPSVQLANNIELLQYALRNFGDTENIYKNRQDEGVIGYHLYRSELIDPEVFDEIDALRDRDEELREVQENLEWELEGKEYFDRGGNERSIFDLAAREIRNLIKSLNKVDARNNTVVNQLGFSELVGFREAFAYIARIVQNSKDLNEMYQRLQAEKEVYAPIAQLLAKLGPLSYKDQTDKEADLWSKFYQTFNKYRIPLVQTTVNETRAEGEVSTFDIKIGNALSDHKRIDADWRAEFAKGIGEFVKNDLEGNYLDLEGVFEKYPTVDAANANPFNFLRDIGIRVKDIGVMKAELEKAVYNGTIRVSGFYSNLARIREFGNTVRNLSNFISHNPKLGIVGQSGPNSNYGKILAMQSKYSGEYSDFMVQNAAGDPQSEYSQNNSLTQIVKQINGAESYNQLVNNPVTAHYNNDQTPGRPYNPFVNASIWIRSLFNMDENGGTRYPDNEIVIDNLSGVNSSINDAFFEEGVASSQADAITKLLNDFHLTLMKFTPELTRHAGKKTSLAVYLRNYKAGARNTRLYIDTENFVTKHGEFNQGFDDFHRILIRYLGAELDRVKYARQMLKDGSGVEQYDFDYLKRASFLVAFDGVLSKETKDALYEIDNLEEFLNSEAGVGLSERIYDEMLSYFNSLVDDVQIRMSPNLFITDSLVEKTQKDAEALGKTNLQFGDIYRGLAASFVANNWIHHFEEMIMLYGDIALYKDFFKRNASLNSTGDVVRNDPQFVNYVNEKLGRPFAKKAGAPAEALSYNGILNAAVVADVEVESVYLEEYKKAVNAPNVETKYGPFGVNEADAQGLIGFDSYRIILKGLSKWTPTQEAAYQQILNGTPIENIGSKEIFPVLKMGYFGPLQTEGLPLTALHKFALMPLIPGLAPNLDKLHEKMMREGIDYLTFKSGSKVATVSGKNGPEPFYKDINKRELNDAPFVKNRAFIEYLKYQVEAKPKYKGKMTLPTQLRKLAEIGLMDKGVPTDYTGNREQWKALSEKERKEVSKNYRLRQAYLKTLRDLVEYKKKELLGDIGWHRNKDGKLVGDMEPMLRLISQELKRSDVGDHEWAYIQTLKGEIKQSLDISMSADVIEKVIVALVNKRLVDIKVKGEQLVMVSTTGFENLSFLEGKTFEKPTEEILAKYGTNDLPTYHIRNGKIAAAKVKIALQGDFKKLLELDDVKKRAKEFGISRFRALNILLKDEEWLNHGENRAMISMVGARIPTQGPNSVDFVEIYEFLPEIVGNVLIAPSEVTSKGGSDFDYDKLPLMMPHIKINAEGKPELARKYDKDQAKEAYDLIVKKNIHKLTFQGFTKEEVHLLMRSGRFETADSKIKNLLGSDYYEELANLVQNDYMDDFETFYEKLNGTSVIENEMQQSLRAIFERPENFAALVRPNDTDMVQPLAEDIRKGQMAAKKVGTRMFEPMHNLEVQQSNSVGKDALGIGAKSNVLNAVFQALGVTLQHNWRDQFDRKHRAKLLFKHNRDEQGRISLSHGTDALNENNIAEVISQLINGWVDVEKDDWISYIQGNKQAAPIMLFMVRAGVPIKDIVKFVTSPVIKRYVQEQQIAKSSFGKVLGKANPRKYRKIARNKILDDFGVSWIKESDLEFLTLVETQGIEDFADFNFEAGVALTGENKQQQDKRGAGFNEDTVKLADDLTKKLKKNEITLEEFEQDIRTILQNSEGTQLKFYHKKFSMLVHPDRGGKLEFAQALNNAVDEIKDGAYKSKSAFEEFFGSGDKKKAVSEVANPELAAFLHYLEIERLANEVTRVERAFNVDTDTMQSITEFYAKMEEIDSVRASGGLISPEFVEQLENNSPIGPFYVQPFAVELFSKLFPLRNNKVLNDYLASLRSEDIMDVYDLSDIDAKVKFYQIFKNDLMNYIFQNELRSFDPLAPYRNNGVEYVVGEAKMNFGAIVKDGKMFINRQQLSQEYLSNAFAVKGYGNGILAPVEDKTAFVNFEEYVHFVYERESLRSMYPKSKVNPVELERYQGEQAYEEWLRDKALFNIFNPYQMFRSSNTIAHTFEYILDKYPNLGYSFSLLKNIKISEAGGYTNLQPATIKWSQDEINIFHENFKDLSNNSRLLNIEGIGVRDAEFIADFFKRLPLYLYMQSGPNTRSQFSFARMLPQDDIYRILEKPVKDLTESMNEEFLADYLSRFIVANADRDSRNRFKEFMASDRDASQISKRPMFTESRLLQQMKFRGKPVRIEKIVNMRGKPGAAKNFPDYIAIDLDLLKVKYQEKAWASPQLEGVDALSEDEFATFDEFLTFVLLHERYHDSITQGPKEDKAAYENRVNTAALEDLRENYQKMQLDLFKQPTSKQGSGYATSFAEMTNHSGGAIGSDSAWDEIGREFGMVNNKHYHAEGDKTPKGNTPIPKDELKTADPFLKDANKTLGRKFPTSNEYVNNLLRRNYWQVKNSDMVAAVATITDNKVNGGTGWAVHMGIAMGKPVFVFDQERRDWFTWINGKFQSTGTPQLTKNFAGIGIRKINDAGRNAIREAYKFTAESMRGPIVNKNEVYDKARYASAIGTASTFMSNFHQLKNPIRDEFGNEYWNSEGYYMALRTNDKAVKKEIAESSKQGGKEARAARRKYQLDMDENRRAEYMLRAVRAKFAANSELASQLTETGDNEIIEKNHWKDDLFGVPDDTRKGANVLGKSLMKVREELKGGSSKQEPILISDEELNAEINKCR